MPGYCRQAITNLNEIEFVVYEARQIRFYVNSLLIFQLCNAHLGSERVIPKICVA